MKIKKPFLIGCAVFICALALFSYLQFSTPHIIGIDGYYHIKAADIIRDTGFIEKQDWWRFSVTQDYDLYFLFHYLLVPFTLLGLVFGAKVYTVVAGSLSVLTLYIWLRHEKVRDAWVYPFLVFVASYVFLYRYSLPRVYLVILPLLALGYYFTTQRRYVHLGVLMFILTNMYSGFPFLIIAVYLIAAIEWVQKRTLDAKLLVTPIIGSILGLVINPYFPDNIRVLYIQQVAPYISPLTDVVLEIDSLPYTFMEFWYVCWGIVLITALAALFVVLSSRKVTLKKIPRAVLFFGAFTIFFFILTTQHRRFVEYWVPFSVLFLGTSIQLYFDTYKKANTWYLKHRSKVLGGTIIVLLVLCGTTLPRLATGIAATTEIEGLYALEPCAIYIAENSPAGSTIFSPWDITPPLHLYNDHNTYIVGMTPVFLYHYDKGLYKKYETLMKGKAANPHALIKNDFQSDYVIVEREKFGFGKYLADQSGFSVVGRGKGCMALRVE